MQLEMEKHQVHHLLLLLFIWDLRQLNFFLLLVAVTVRVAEVAVVREVVAVEAV
jgi:hypothetical protein